ncbi:MAG TPA: twin-arginine translocase TatA/TatE family subunit [Nitrososphaerales archaeon]|nr:twin-arginine translocase TatA/TatE family subunit [Nitrososphaerales archaeon]
MALDDPFVWVLILSVIIFLFGSSKIPQFARSMGQARWEFENGWKGITSEVASGPGATVALNVPKSPPSVIARDTQFPPTSTSSGQTIQQVDPLVLACQKEGIDTASKTRTQLASELSWKLNKNMSRNI